MAWVRTDGRKILDDLALLKKGETDIALCNANLDSGAVDEGARKCMGLKGYALVRKDDLRTRGRVSRRLNEYLRPRRGPVAVILRVRELRRRNWDDRPSSPRVASLLVDDNRATKLCFFCPPPSELGSPDWRGVLSQHLILKSSSMHQHNDFAQKSYAFFCPPPARAQTHLALSCSR